MAVDMDGCQSGLLSFFAKEMLLQNNHRFKSCTILQNGIHTLPLRVERSHGMFYHVCHATATYLV